MKIKYQQRMHLTGWELTALRLQLVLLPLHMTLNLPQGALPC
jgi:hypothetical protein